VQLTPAATVTATPHRAVATVIILDDDTAPPQVDNQPGAHPVGVSNAMVHGRLLSAGALPTAIWLYWGMNDGEQTASNWERMRSIGPASEGAIDVGLTDLVADTTYFYRFVASNAVGTTWSPVSAVFTTLPLAGALDLSIASSSDDAEETQTGRMEAINSLGSADLELVFDHEGFPVRSNQTVGLRFTRVVVPSRATIREAWIQFTADETTNQPGTLFVRGEARD